MAPLKQFNAGARSAALWENDAVVDGRKFRLLRATVERLYKESQEADAMFPEDPFPWQSFAEF